MLQQRGNKAILFWNRDRYAANSSYQQPLKAKVRRGGEVIAFWKSNKRSTAAISNTKTLTMRLRKDC